MKQTLDEIRSRIPRFKCKEGCHDCCGPVPFSKEEWDRINDKREATSLTCPYLGAKGCDIYEERPIMCRLFGVVEDLLCPHGCRPVGFLSRSQARKIMGEVYNETSLGKTH